MRTLKYRIYDEKKNVWVRDLIQFYAGDSLVKQGHIIQDYTGLKDKNGKEIYEGDYINFSTDCTHPLGDKDIIEWKNQVVHYDDKLACFFFGYKYEFQMMDKIMPETLEVVGNIFDNPELIEQ
jgi:uncharacterized phage protein (TIGR01671 family)